MGDLAGNLKVTVLHVGYVSVPPAVRFRAEGFLAFGGMYRRSQFLGAPVPLLTSE